MTISKKAWKPPWDRRKQQIEPVVMPAIAPPSYVQTSYGRVWGITEEGPRYWGYIGVFRIMWPNRVIVFYRWPGNFDDFRPGMTIEILYGLCRPNAYYANAVGFRFTNCQMRRKWVPRPVAMNHMDNAVLDVYLELACDIVDESAKFGRPDDER